MPDPALAPRPSDVAPGATTRRGAGVPAASAVPRDKRLEAERKLVEMARTALARGQTADALAALRRHQRFFPNGELAEERDGLWVSALVATHEYAQAREQAVRFRRHHPHSLFAPVVEQAIQSIP
jgi:outer membrane protein assembly factor BamD (BamD/ComL family)